jgi:CheY-like chemotaxis protein
LNILFIEDSIEDVNYILFHLKESMADVKYDVIETKKDFYYAMKRERFDVILCDFQMPSMAPYDALRIKKRYGWKTPFIVLSKVITEEDFSSLASAGADDFIPKNNLSRLIPAIRREISDVRSLETAAELRKKFDENEKSVLRVILALQILNKKISKFFDPEKTPTKAMILKISDDIRRLFLAERVDIVTFNGKTYDHTLNVFFDGMLSKFHKFICAGRVWQSVDGFNSNAEQVFLSKIGQSLAIFPLVTPKGKLIGVFLFGFNEIRVFTDIEIEAVQTITWLLAAIIQNINFSVEIVDAISYATAKFSCMGR